jgi:hypothetical protein
LETGARHRESFQDRPGNQGGLYTPDGRRILYSVLVGSELEMFIKNTGDNDKGEVVPTGLKGSKEIADL